MFDEGKVLFACDLETGKWDELILQYETDSEIADFSLNLIEKNPHYNKSIATFFKFSRCKKNSQTKELLKSLEISDTMTTEEKVLAYRRYIDRFNYPHSHRCLAYCVVNLFFQKTFPFFFLFLLSFIF